MRSILLLLAAWSNIPAVAQVSNPSEQQGKEPELTLRSTARLVSVDVVVTDSSGKSVTGLNKTDFLIHENKSEQQINSFDEHREAALTSAHVPKAGTYTNAIAVQGTAANVLLLDWLNTPSRDRQYMRDQLVKFVNAEKPGTQTAIFALGSDLHLLQDFTSDPTLLRAAILKQGVKFSPLLSEARDTDSTVQAYENMIEGSTNPEVAAMLAGLQSLTVTANYKEQSGQERIRIQETMKALSDIARYLAGGSMRKNLIWISGSFPVNIQRDLATTADPFAGSASFEQEFKKTADLLAEGKVAVYPIDPIGIVLPPSSMTVDGNSSTNLAAIRRANDSNSFTPTDDLFHQAQVKQHDTMESLAEATGGRAAFNSNDLIAAIRQAEQNGSEYYTLTYAPPSASDDKGFCSIDVRVKGKGLHAAYRRGYYAASSIVPPSTSSSRLASVMLPLTLQSSEVLFTAEPLPTQQPLPGKAIGESAASSSSPIVYSLNLVVDPSTITFIAAVDGKMRASIDFATVLYDAQGRVVDSRSDHAELALDQVRYQGIVQGGLRFHHNIALSSRRDESVRIAVHDATTDRIGTLQLTSAQISGHSRPNL